METEWWKPGYWNDPIRQLEDGWYFETEDERLEGPYETYALAKVALDEYCEWLERLSLDLSPDTAR